MAAGSNFITPEIEKVFWEISDIEDGLKRCGEDLGSDLFTLSGMNMETWAGMPDRLWDLANNLRELARRTYRAAGEWLVWMCGETEWCTGVATEETVPEACSYMEEAKSDAAWTILGTGGQNA